MVVRFLSWATDGLVNPTVSVSEDQSGVSHTSPRESLTHIATPENLEHSDTTFLGLHQTEVNFSISVIGSHVQHPTLFLYALA